MAKETSEATPEETVLDGATFASMADGSTKIVLAAMFHEDPTLVTAEKTESDWADTVGKWLAETA